MILKFSLSHSLILKSTNKTRKKHNTSVNILHLLLGACQCHRCLNCHITLTNPDDVAPSYGMRKVYY